MKDPVRALALQSEASLWDACAVGISTMVEKD